MLFSLSGQDGKTYPLCPFCYNYPPFEEALKVRDMVCVRLLENGLQPRICQCSGIPAEWNYTEEIVGEECLCEKVTG